MAAAGTAAARPHKRARITTNVPAVLTGALNTKIISPPLPDDAPALRIGTHDGKFHCDEALACAMLSTLPKYRGACVVRTRNHAALAECDTVVDVGAEYDAAKNRFDHHQKEFDGTLDGHAVKLSSAGLVYKHFGRDVIRAVLGEGVPDDTIETLYERVYTDFVEHIDGIDNGIESTSGEKRYKVTTDLSSRVSRLHPGWNEDASDTVVNECFRDAVLLTGTELIECVESLHSQWLPARQIVRRTLAAATDDGAVTVLETFCPWQSHLFALESEGKAPAGALKYVVYEDSRGMWRVQAVPEAEGSFASRLPLPAAWRGLRDADLCAASGVDGATFVHAAGFIGGHKHKEGALEMARLALKQ